MFVIVLYLGDRKGWNKELVRARGMNKEELNLRSSGEVFFLVFGFLKGVEENCKELIKR